MKSHFRKPTYHRLGMDTKARGTFETHLRATHRAIVHIGVEGTVKRIFEHAKHANPALLPASAKRASEVPNEARLHLIDVHHGTFKLPSGLEALGKSGHHILYRWSAAGPGIAIPHPADYQAHFVVNPEKRSISYYGGFMKDRQITELFQHEKGDIHDAYWEAVDKTEKQTGKHIHAVSVEFEPETGQIVHIRERVLRNVMGEGGGRSLYSVDIESSMPFVEERIQGRTPSISHTVTARNRIGEYNEKYPNSD